MSESFGAIILAAGESSRLGRSKQTLRLPCGEALVERAVRIAREANLGPTLVITGANAAEVEPLIEDQVASGGVATAHNTRWREGMGSSIACGVVWMRARDVAGAMVLVVDQVHLTSSDLERLVLAARPDGVEVAAAEYDGVLGVPACFMASCFDALESLAGSSRGARSLMRSGALGHVEAVRIPHAAQDLDTLEDLERIAR